MLPECLKIVGFNQRTYVQLVNTEWWRCLVQDRLAICDAIHIGKSVEVGSAHTPLNDI
jgi:hypothetical protein